MKKAYFITFEGIDGCGKTTAVQKTAEYLAEQGIDCMLTREPGGTEWGKQMRKMLLHSDYALDSRTEALLFAADRAEHMHKLIMPALERGEWVLCDRFSDSTLAYQGGGRGMDIERLAALSDFAAGGKAPDLTFYLAISYEDSLQRRDAAADRMEQEREEFFLRTADVYESLAVRYPERIIRIDAAVSIDEVWQQLKLHLDRIIEDE